jgi:hypothetical protein
MLKTKYLRFAQYQPRQPSVSRTGLALQVERELSGVYATIDPKKMSKTKYKQTIDEKTKLIEALFLD